MDLNIKVNDKNHLDIGGADAVDIAEEFGTPTYGHLLSTHQANQESLGD